jgi:hypothetical protein
MGIVASITSESVTSSSWFTFFHGTDYTSGLSIVNDGLDYKRLLATTGAHRFCTTTNPSNALIYAGLNVAVQTAKGIPAVVRFDLPRQTLREFFLNMPPLAYEILEDEALEYMPDAFETMVSVRPPAWWLSPARTGPAAMRPAKFCWSGS